MIYMGVEAFLVDYDGLVGFKGMANFYLYRPEGARQAVFIPWDKDQTFYRGQSRHRPWPRRQRAPAPGHRDSRSCTPSSSTRWPRPPARPRRAPDGADRAVDGGRARAGPRPDSRGAVLADPGRWFGVQDFEDEMRPHARVRAHAAGVRALPGRERAAPRRAARVHGARQVPPTSPWASPGRTSPYMTKAGAVRRPSRVDARVRLRVASSRRGR